MIPLRIRAVNTAADSENKIHDDRVAAQYGFRGGLVPGVTVYGYLASAVIDHFDDQSSTNPWLTRGALDVRFQKPVYEDDEVVVTVEPQDGGRARVEIAGCASAVAWLHDEAAPCSIESAPPGDRRAPASHSLQPGTILGALDRPLDLSQARLSAPLDSAIGPDLLAHPAILLGLANEIFVANYELGPWIHAASEVRKFSPVRDGERIRVRARIEEQFERKGHDFVVLNVHILAADGRLIEHVRHTAIWRPRVVK
jgi:acyl dehydratase